MIRGCWEIGNSSWKKWYTWNESYIEMQIWKLNEIKWSYAPRSYERNFSNCVEKTGKFRTSKRFEPVTLLRRCGALTIWATKPQMVGAGHLTVQMFPWWMDQWTKWNKWWIIYRTADMKSSEAMILELLLSCSNRYFTRSLRHLSFSTLLSLESYGNIVTKIIVH